jgi:HPr kinase/phosphorylase
MKASTVHGTAICIGKTGVLIRGAPGAGKSALALTMLDQPGYGLGSRRLTATLVADDQVELRIRHGKIIMSAPPMLKGKLEIRGHGIVPLTVKSSIGLDLVVDLAASENIERMPETIDKKVEFLGIWVPRLQLSNTDPAAAARLRAVVGLLVASKPAEA